MVLSDAVVRQLETRVARARKFGIWIDAVVQEYADVSFTRMTGEWQASLNRPITAASINKLAVAVYAAASPHNVMLTWSDAEVRSGGGVFDQPGASRQALFFDVLYDMIANSGNTAMVVLGRYHVAEVNELVGGSHLVPVDDGFFLTGSTTPEDAIDTLIALWLGMSPAARIVREALQASRTHIPRVRGVTVASKHGELNDDDSWNGKWPYLRHEAGLMMGQNRSVVGYAIFTQCRNHVSAKLAEQTIGQLGAVLTQLVGARPSGLATRIGKSVFTP